MDIVIDTCVLIDILISGRSRHDKAILLANKLADDTLKCGIPMHCMFELVSAVRSEFNSKGAPLKSDFIDEKIPFEFELIPIDDSFLKKYLFETLKKKILVKLKAGDMIFVLLAMRHDAILITEDKPMKKTAESLGLKAVSIKEYLDEE